MFETQLVNNNKELPPLDTLEDISINEVDMLNGKEFEQFILYLYKKMGFMMR